MKKKINLFIFLVLGIVMISIVFLHFLLSETNSNQNQKKNICVPNVEYFVYYDDLNKNFYFKVGVLVDINGDPFEGANAYVIINNTKYYSITDKMGYVNFTISSQNVSIDDLNDRHTITFQKDGYDKVEFIINVRY